MATNQIVEGLWRINLGAVNAYLLDGGELDSARRALTLIDTGVPKSEGKIVAAIEAIGRTISDLQHIIVTHCHPDHSGSVAVLKRLSGARVYMHAADAAMVRKGESWRPMTASPGLLRRLMFTLFVPKKPTAIDPCAVDEEIRDGTELPIAGGLKVIHAPGHCAGQVVLLWPRRRLIFAADACANLPNFGYALGYEDLELGKASLRKLAALDFDAAVFGHGNPITSGASKRFRDAFA